ncbi:MAG: hypothetical protein ACD_2C00241G0007 [uncultured bacterium (gcode 4)]|uniref:Baseplate protein J-like domain-containing protein n=1 Tax=uncultured bacterium (gcode 4) TaxID=1234023 RepID=K2GFG7_9BACT|nr:MAG: hypothetical protein ACD_2C00241G0007 [uncultured bacterium (gcode 4)]
MEWYKKIKIENSDSLFDICKKVQTSTSTDGSFYLEVDENESLKNYLNLKILLSKFAWKKFAIVTWNKEIKKVGEKLWIRYFYKSDEIEFDEKFSKTNVLRHNFTFHEYMKYELKKFTLKYLFLFKKKAKKTYNNKQSWPESHVFLLLIWLILSFSLLSFIFYFAVSKTYVYITPELWVKTVSRNMIFSEKDNANVFDSKSIIKVNAITQDSSVEFPFHVSSIDLKSAKNAYWRVTVYNEMNTEQIFKPNTRFMSEDWLVYRSSEWIKVPGSRKDEAWKTVVWQVDSTLIADMYDNYWKITWVRWNISEWIVLTIPGLKFNRDKIYAKTSEPMHDWLDPKNHILTQEEYEKFVWIINEKVKTKALNDIKDKIKAMNTSGWSNFHIAPINNILQYTINPPSILKWVKIGDITDEVTLTASWRLATYVFDKNATVFFLRTVLNENILLWTEKLIWINDDSLRITNILSQSVNPFYMKATTELDSTISYNFEDSTNNLTRKLKNLIANTDKKEATSILLNDTNIANVKIEFSPFWLTRVSNNPDNIEFIIQK